MAFWDNIISGIKSLGRDKIAAQIDKATEKINEKSLTAQREFDYQPLFWQMQSLEQPIVRTGFYWEVKDAWETYTGDDRVRATIDSIADDATEVNHRGLPFNVSVKDENGEDSDKAQEITSMFHSKFKALKIYQRSSDMIKFALLEGSRFYRIVADFTTGEIVELRHIKGPRNGFVMIQISEGQYKDYYVQLEYTSQQAVAAFLPWEVIRFDWNKPDESAFGMGLFSSGRRNYKRLEKTEGDLYIARKSRAYAKMSREYPGASVEELLRIRQQDLEDRKRHGSGDIETDIYTTGKASILEASNSALFNIGDVEYSQRRLFASGRRPVSLLGGYGKDAVNRAVLDRQESRYVAGFLSAVIEMFESGMERLINNQLILWGYLPKDWSVSFEWTKKSVEKFETLAVTAKDGVDRKALPLSVYANLFDLDPAQVQKEIEEDMARMAEMEEKYGVPSMDQGFQAPQ